MQSSTTCDLCDFIQFYYLTQYQKCEKIFIQYCKYISPIGQCLLCEDGYYLISYQNKCVKIDQKEVIQNCKHQITLTTCSQCESNFYLSGSQCNQIQTSIQNCLYYDGKNSCQQCKDGYINNLDKTQCLQITQKVDNCAGYSNLLCEKCSDGYILNKGYYSLFYTISSNLSDYTINEFIRQQDNDYTPLFLPQCQKIILSNCIIAENFNHCSKCEFGYFIDSDGQCQSNPVQKIANCKTYSNLYQCSQCSDNYHLNNEFLCVKVEDIQNCKFYDTSSKSTVCIQCIDGFYLQSSSLCLERMNAYIEQCEKLSLTSDICEKCLEEYQINSNGKICLAVVPNCILYDQKTNDINSLKCLQCKVGYRVDNNNLCIQGSQINCTKFSFNQDVCQECENGYYLSSNKECLKHQIIKNCSIYSQSIQNRCDQCNDNSILFTTNTYCIEAQQINYCIKYSSQNGCELCADGYELQNEMCILIEQPLNCIQKSLSICTKCKSSYFLLNNQCFKKPDFLFQNCELDNIISGTNDLNNMECLYCKELSYPINFIDKYICVNEQWLNLYADFYSFNIIDNCEQISIEINNNIYQVICKKCSSEYYLENNTCVSNCSNGDTPTVYSISDQGGKYQVDALYQCQTVIDYCKQASISVQGNIDYYCGQCKDDYYSVITLFYSGSNQIYPSLIAVSSQFNDFQTNNGLNNDPVSYYPVVQSCLQQAEIEFVENCQYYAEQNNEIVCVRCKMGYTGKIKNSTSIYIYECIELQDCINITYPGLPAALNQFISCHKCQSNKYPIAFIYSGSFFQGFKGYYPYDPEEVVSTWQDLAFTSGTTIRCLELNSINLKLSSDVDFPQNCAIYMRNVYNNITDASDISKTSNIDQENLAVVCISCLPGYYPIFGVSSLQTNIPYMIGQCELISNCEYSEWFNNCSQCKNNYVYLFQNETVKYDQCINFSDDPNCFTASNLNDNLECQFCKKGYIFNEDGKCENLTPLYCDLFSMSYTFTQKLASTIFYLQQFDQGCTKCHSGYISLQQKKNTQICIPSSYIETNDFSTQDYYIKNCKNYYRENMVLKCKICNSAYIIDESNLNCYSQINLSNCLVAYDNSNCSICSDAYIVINYQCQIKSISYCLQYEQNPTQIKQRCQQCIPGYYLSESGKCYEGKILNCDQYLQNSSTDCIQCIEGYILVLTNQKYYCFPKPTSIQCNSILKSDFRKQKITCDSCLDQSPLFLSSENIQQTFCFEYTKIDNCLEYDINYDFGDSTFLCQKCEQNYYSEYTRCLKRKNIDSKCTKFQNFNDYCEICQEGYFLGANDYCEENPVGISYCEQYSQNNQCSKCEKDYYLQDNECKLVETFIEKCSYYLSPTVCSQCKKGYLFEGTQCIQSIASNCVTYDNLKACKTCEYGYGLKTISEITSCVATNNPYCIDYELEYPFSCNICQTLYYPNESGYCIRSEKIIENCEYYIDSKYCLKCKKGNVLSIDQTQCDSSIDILTQLDPNCDNNKLSQQTQCVICQKGYYLDQENSCHKCQVDGCYFCNSVDSSNCLICKSGYYMDQNRNCIQILEQIVEVVDSSYRLLQLLQLIPFIIFL